jgi:hypothetical protein
MIKNEILYTSQGAGRWAQGDGRRAMGAEPKGINA